jgi:hypothetical protein
MRNCTVSLVLVVVPLVGACFDAAEDCHNLGSCPPDAGAAPTPSDVCGGTCVPGGVSPSWSPAPWPVWFGATQAPANLCAQVDRELHEAFDGTVRPSPVCGVCTCSAPSGSCEVSSITESSASCMTSTPGLTSQPFAPPSGWNGSCLPVPAVAGAVESVTVAPVVVNETCTPHVVTTMDRPRPGDLAYAHACGSATATCPNEGDVCVPALPKGKVLQGLPSGLWTYCVTSPTETAAPCPSEYPIERDFGNGWSTPTCADCTCDLTGGSCGPSLVTFYEDGACTSTSADEDGSVKAQASTPMCLDVPAAPGSMSAAPSVYTPGTCTPGGGASSPPTAAEPMTFCCQE